jgi:hypothetical protein
MCTVDLKAKFSKSSPKFYLVFVSITPGWITYLNYITMHHMRQLIDFTMPEHMPDEEEVKVKDTRFGLLGKFFRAIVRAYRIEVFLYHARQGRKEIAAGKGVTLRSIRDLR